MKIVWRDIPEARLLIAGAITWFTPQLEKLVCSELTETERTRVAFVHNFPEEEKPALFAACDVFAYPSRYESFGIAFIEAWAAGKPVVGCAAGAVPSVVDNGVDGMLVAVDDAPALGRALTRLLRSPELRKRMAQSGRAKVRQRYTWDVVAPRWRQVYERTLD